MLNLIKNFLVMLLTTSMLTMVPIAQADWTSTLGDLWEQTKAKTANLSGVFNPSKPVEIGIAYGTEKKPWFEWAIAEFAKTEEGKKIKITLIPIGSIEGAEKILQKDERIQVWSPASSVVEELLVEPWEKEYKKSPIISDAPLALTPLVMVMWQDRYGAFITKYTEVNFKNIASALAEITGWTAIANQPEWGVFNFGHTNPTLSNSGLLTLVLMAYDYADVFRDLSVKQVMNEGFITWLKETEGAMSTEEESTNNLIKTMLQRGPSEFSGIVTYENLALSNLNIAEGRWGKLQIVYPTRSVWNDNPYYILDTPWSNEEKQNAAKLFQKFLLSARAQKEARDKYLFRPASLEVPILDNDSAFSKLKDVVKIDVATIKRPKAEVLQQLIQLWKKVQ